MTLERYPNALYVGFPHFLARLLGVREVWTEIASKGAGRVAPWFSVERQQPGCVVWLGRLQLAFG